MTEDIRKALLDLRARQESGEHMPCPRCGRDTMLPRLYTNALSRHADGIFVCSGIINNKKERVIEALKAAGMEIVAEQSKNDWMAYVAKKHK